MAVRLVGTAIAVGLAEIYSEVVGTETSTRQPVSRRGPAPGDPQSALVALVGAGLIALKSLVH
jgi:hypothetical protein